MTQHLGPSGGPRIKGWGGWSHRLEWKGARGCRAARVVTQKGLPECGHCLSLPLQGRIGLGHLDSRGILSSTWLWDGWGQKWVRRKEVGSSLWGRAFPL